MRKLLSAVLMALGLVAAAPVAAEAANGYTTGDVNMRAGPGTNYPRILVIQRGTPVTIYGCLEGYSWCDVGVWRERGWVSSRYLDAFYRGQAYVPYRPAVQLPIITFGFGYWDRWYSNRPWYYSRPGRPGRNDPDRPLRNDDRRDDLIFLNPGGRNDGDRSDGSRGGRNDGDRVFIDRGAPDIGRNDGGRVFIDPDGGPFDRNRHNDDTQRPGRDGAGAQGGRNDCIWMNGDCMAR